jgi:phosphoribosyl 1,2-cyclic phosphate phosphodiesterase
LRAGLDRLDAVLFTHGHADHIMGLDDIRPYNLKQRSIIPIYGNDATLAVVRRTFSYIFDEAPTDSTIPLVELRHINGPFELCGMRIVPVPLMHGPLPVLGYRVGGVAYLTDFSLIPEASKTLLRGLDHLILDALRFAPHPMHSTIAQSLELVRELAPRHAWFTHMSHDVSHAETEAQFPANVRLAYDGLTFEAQL